MISPVPPLTRPARLRFPRVLAAAAAAFLLQSTGAQEPLKEAIEERVEAQGFAISSQQRVDALADERNRPRPGRRVTECGRRLTGCGHRGEG